MCVCGRVCVFPACTYICLSICEHMCGFFWGETEALHSYRRSASIKFSQLIVISFAAESFKRSAGTWREMITVRGFFAALNASTSFTTLKTTSMIKSDLPLSFQISKFNSTPRLLRWNSRTCERLISFWFFDATLTLPAGKLGHCARWYRRQLFGFVCRCAYNLGLF